MRVLIVDDEKNLADALVQIFAANNITADACYDGVSGLEGALSGIYDVVILDIMLPKMNGLDMLDRLRAEKSSVPVLMLTAMDELTDKVRGFERGADDYLTKPFHTEELIARVKALDRRKSVNSEALSSDGSRITYGDITLDISGYELCRGDNKVKLGLKEFLLMEYFIKNGGKVLTKENLILKVWGNESEAEYNNVEVYISFLRKKMNFINSEAAIKTVRGVGYCLEK